MPIEVFLNLDAGFVSLLRLWLTAVDKNVMIMELTFISIRRAAHFGQPHNHHST